jgi:hypothetical protein
VESLPPGTGFTIRVFAYNAKGSSDRVELRGFTLGVDTQKHIRFLHILHLQSTYFFYPRAYLKKFSPIILLKFFFGWIILNSIEKNFKTKNRK